MTLCAWQLLANVALDTRQDELTVPLLLAVGLLTFILWWYYRKRERINMLRELAEEWNWEFIEEENDRIPPELENVPMAEDFIFLCRQRICGVQDGINIAIFDLTVFEFKISKNFTYTALALRHPDLDLPLFTLKHRTKFEDGLQENRGVQFPDDFEFTQQMRIDALDYAAVRKRLTQEFRDLIRNEDDISIIGNRDTLFIHKYPGHLSRDEIERSLKQGIGLVKALLKKDQRMSASSSGD
ncbi:MAG: hypothetical protein D6820_09650 [Lentisphaerae bacterium]|nr:MAG: hypothetical protein D6820_09650 [Lentisphaerota bacterium]